MGLIDVRQLFLREIQMWHLSSSNWVPRNTKVIGSILGYGWYGKGIEGYLQTNDNFNAIDHQGYTYYCVMKYAPSLHPILQLIDPQPSPPLPSLQRRPLPA